jgi:hypothetical protein
MLMKSILILFFLLCFGSTKAQQSKRCYTYDFGLSIGVARTISGFNNYMLSASIGFAVAPLNLTGSTFRNNTFIDEVK